LSGLALIGGYAADLALGDPPRWHPVAGFGRLAQHVERRAYAPTRRRGTAVAATLIAAAGLLAEGLARTRLGRGRVLVALTWVALGGRSLRREGLRVADAVSAGRLEAARSTLPALVGRDLADLDESELCRAAVESLAENTADAVVGTLLWAALAGAPGVAAYRAVNTLDAMIGHRSPRYARFGWAAARLDDLMNWPVARLGALLTVASAPMVGGSSRGTWRALRRDGDAHPSPNAGQMEAAFAGALGVRLGGPLSYGGLAELRPVLGEGPPPDPQTVRRAAGLSLAVGTLAVGTLAAALCAGGRR
jgi:adenosylcobinamide-phosphate synthase